MRVETGDRGNKSEEAATLLLSSISAGEFSFFAKTTEWMTIRHFPMQWYHTTESNKRAQYINSLCMSKTSYQLICTTVYLGLELKPAHLAACSPMHKGRRHATSNASHCMQQISGSCTEKQIRLKFPTDSVCSLACENGRTIQSYICEPEIAFMRPVTRHMAVSFGLDEDLQSHVLPKHPGEIIPSSRKRYGRRSLISPND